MQVCAKCGSKNLVHDRYLGGRLTCSKCGSLNTKRAFSFPPRIQKGRLKFLFASILFAAVLLGYANREKIFSIARPKMTYEQIHSVYDALSYIQDSQWSISSKSIRGGNGDLGRIMYLGTPDNFALALAKDTLEGIYAPCEANRGGFAYESEQYRYSELPRGTNLCNTDKQSFLRAITKKEREDLLKPVFASDENPKHIFTSVPEDYFEKGRKGYMAIFVNLNLESRNDGIYLTQLQPALVN